jgi:hypothetical protein
MRSPPWTNADLEVRSMIPKKPAPAKAGVDTGFRKKTCSNKELERDDDSKKRHHAPAAGNDAARFVGRRLTLTAG